MIYAMISVEAAYDVACYLEARLKIDTAIPEHERQGFEDVRDALYAIANDTDAIVTDEELADMLAAIPL
jgi:hypothetical protein